MKEKHFETIEELTTYAQQIEGLTFSEIDRKDRLANKSNKGGLGAIVEESYFGYKINSDAKPDFENLGVELKVTPVKENKDKTLSAKERLVLNIINYEEEYKNTFEMSSFWQKNETLLILFYLWRKELNRGDYPIIKSLLHQFPEEDLLIIKKDWETIIQKIKEGKAHELSESDTNYLGAAPKGASSKSLRTQPFSEKKAMQRAYSLKTTYMTSLIREVINGEQLQSITDADHLKKASLEEIIHSFFTPYIGMSIEEIARDQGVTFNPSSKSFVQQFVTNLIGLGNTKINKIEEFEKANIKLKTIRLEPNGLPQEHMSFPNVDFIKWTQTEWEDSKIKQYFEETKFLFAIFEYKETKKENPNRQLYFKKIAFWNMPNTMIQEDLKSFWLDTKNHIQHRLIVNKTKTKQGKTRYENNLPKPSETEYFHIRPKATNNKDLMQLPDGSYMPKQGFWFNKTTLQDLYE